MAEPGHAHPTPKQYVQIAIFLAVLTAVEVGLFYLEQGVDAIGTSMTAPALIFLALIKFVAVVGYYMHLRFENRLLSRFFVVGFVAALALYGAVIGSMLFSADIL